MNAVQTALAAGWWLVLVTSKVADVVPLFKTVFNNLTILLLNNGAVGSPGWPLAATTRLLRRQFCIN